MCWLFFVIVCYSSLFTFVFVVSLLLAVVGLSVDVRQFVVVVLVWCL